MHTDNNIELGMMQIRTEQLLKDDNLTSSV